MSDDERIALLHLVKLTEHEVDCRVLWGDLPDTAVARKEALGAGLVSIREEVERYIKRLRYVPTAS